MSLALLSKRMCSLFSPCSPSTYLHMGSEKQDSVQLRDVYGISQT